MELKLEGFLERIEKHDAEFRASPRRYKIKVFGMAFLGYAVVLAALLLNLAVIAALVFWQKSGGPSGWIIFGYGVFGVLLLTTIRSLFVPLPLPPGVELVPEEFPYLFQVVEKLRRPLKLRRKNIRVVINWDFNAFAFSRPLFGLVGPSRLYLGVGLPLLAALNEEQIKAILSHELAHFSRKHSRFVSWIGRLQMIWTDLLTRLQNRPFTGLLFRAFANWYSHRFSVMAIILIRHSEFEADKLAAEVVGERAMAKALLRTAIRSNLVVEQYWKEVWRNALVTEQPSRRAISRLLTRLGNNIPREDALEELRWLLGEATEMFDEHPCLSERLEALGVALPGIHESPAVFLDEWSLVHPETTLHLFLSQHRRGSEVFLDAVWELASFPEWQMVHLESKPLRDQMVALDSEWKENGTLSIEKAWRRTLLTISYFGEKQAMPIIETVLKMDKSHPHANFAAGCQLLKERDPIGILMIEEAMEKDPLSYQEAGLSTLSDFYRRMGAMEDFHESRLQSFEAAETTLKAVRERSGKISVKDCFLPAPLPTELREELARTFEAMPSVRKVYLVCKEVEHLPESPFYIFGTVPTLRRGAKRDSELENLGSRIAFSGSHTAVALTWSRLFLGRKMAAAAGEPLYRKPFFRRRKKKSKERKKT